MARGLGRHLIALLVTIAPGVALSGCRAERQQGTTGGVPSVGRPGPAAPAPLCPGGQSEDPPLRDLDRALGAFAEKRYRDAQAALDALAASYPRSATARVWRGEATLYEGKLDDGVDRYREAASQALQHYRAAQRLHESGCALLASDHYYLRMGSAYAHLRLGAPNPALAQLEVAKEAWPESAEIPYTMARAECARDRVDPCLERLRETLELARERRRPMFLRTHRSVADWVARSRTQSELGPLRADPRYAELLRLPWIAAE